MSTIHNRTVLFTQKNTHTQLAHLYNRKRFSKEITNQQMTRREGREGAGKGEKNKKQQQKRQRWNQKAESPQEANRQTEKSNRGGDLFLTAAALSSSLSPMTKQAALMCVVLPSCREPAQLHNIYRC